MADNKKNVQNNNVTTQEVAQQVVEAANDVVNAQAVAIAQDAVQQVPATQEAQVPAEQKVPFKEKAKAFGKKAWKVVRWPLAIAGVIGIAIGAEKIGEGVGFDKATDAYDKRSGGDPDPEPDYNPDDDLGDEGIEEVSED